MSTSRQAPVVWFPTIRAGSGADVFTRRLAQGLHQRGIPARITWLPHRAEYAPWLIPPPSPPAGTNIVHVNTWLPERFMPRGLPIVATMHHCVHDPQFSPYKSGLQAFYHRVWIKPMERVVLQRANRVAAVSHYTAQRTLAAFDIPDITVIHNGIDLDGAFRPACRSAPHTPFRLLYVGNWSKRKGAELLRPIMRSLGAGFELRYTGEPLQQGAANMHCVGRPQSEPDLAGLYQDADALLFPSRLEGFGLVALEAQACGLPVIATRGSALPEVVQDGETGLLCAPDDVPGFATAARELAGNPELWQRMGRAGRTRVEAHFSMQHMIDRYIELYEEVLDAGA